MLALHNSGDCTKPRAVLVLTSGRSSGSPERVFGNVPWRRDAGSGQSRWVFGGLPVSASRGYL